MGRILGVGCVAVALAAMLLTWFYSAHLTFADWMMAEAASPEGRLIARSWCEDACDNPTLATITISPSDRGVGLEQRERLPPGGNMPDEDVAARVHFQGDDNPSLTWQGTQRLIVAAGCVSDGNDRPHRPARLAGVEIRLVRAAAPASCQAELR